MSLRSAFAWSLAGQLVSVAATFGATVLLTRMLTPREIGIYAAGLAVLGVLQAVSAFGIGSYVIREEKLTPAVLSTAFTINAFLCVFLAGAMIAAGFSDWITAGEPQVRTVLHLLAVVPLLGAFELRPATMLQREMNFHAISLVTTARSFAGAAVSVAAAWYGAGALSAAYGGIAQALTGALAFSFLGRAHVGVAISVAGWRTMLGFGFQVLAIGGVSTASARASDFVLGRILGFAPLGVYSRASALSNTIFQNCYASLTRVLFSRLAADHRAGAGTATSYLKGLEILLALLWPLLGGLAVLAGPVVQILFGARWLAAAPPLAILMAALAISLTFAMNHELFILHDRLAQQTRRELLRSALGLAAFVIGCTFGLVGAALARVADALVGLALYGPLLPGLSGVRVAALLRVYLVGLALAAAAIAPAAVVMQQSGWSPATPLPAIAAAVAAGMLLWVLALKYLRHPLFEEIVRIFEYRSRKGRNRAIELGS
jgi:O-antigen/teichoic acid export membrane protein